MLCIRDKALQHLRGLGGGGRLVAAAIRLAQRALQLSEACPQDGGHGIILTRRSTRYHAKWAAAVQWQQGGGG